jgi:predicted TIM-barrel fold metal-dependent hydrolase
MPKPYDPKGNSVRSLAETAGWQAGEREEILDPDLPIVDPHHHIWMKPDDSYLAADLERDFGSGHNIVATVFIECVTAYRPNGPTEMKPVGETEFVVRSLPERPSGTRFAAGIVGRADLSLGDRVRPVLEAQIEAGQGRFRGIRRPVRWDPEGIGLFGKPFPQSLALDMEFRKGVAQLEPLGLSFDGWLFHHQLGEFADLAAAFPNTPMILNHVGGPLGVGRFAGHRAEVFEDWRKAMAELARLPNVLVKIGGLGMLYYGFDFHMRPEPPHSSELAQAWSPYVLECVELFGPSRCMFESNFPVDKQSCSYRTLWNAFKRITNDFSTDEKTALFSGVAAKAYRLDLA